MSQVVVIGAGAAGIVAAWRAASLGVRVVLLEKNDRIGIKILISGGGKCNITHSGSVEELLKAFRPNEARFLRPSCYRFTNLDIVDMLTARGLDVYTRPDGRIFPTEGNAKDVVRILGDYFREAGVHVRVNAGVTAIESEEIDGTRRVTGVRVGNELIETRHVILCAGGSSYPGSGTTGDGWPWARELGHSIVKVRAALAPIFLDPPTPTEWAGVALRDCLLRARQFDREIAKWRGDLLFTHRGVSGPTVLGISREVAELRAKGPIRLEADLLPDNTFESLSNQILDTTRAAPRRSVRTMITEWVPDRVVDSILQAADLESAIIGAYLTLKARNRLVATLKAWTIGWVQHVPLEKGEVVAGGISLDEVDSQTMRSRRADGLYVAGEVLDIAGPIGGYNLQAAFSTGFVAGETAAKDATESN